MDNPSLSKISSIAGAASLRLHVAGEVSLSGERPVAQVALATHKVGITSSSCRYPVAQASVHWMKYPCVLQSSHSEIMHSVHESGHAVQVFSREF